MLRVFSLLFAVSSICAANVYGDVIFRTDVNASQSGVQNFNEFNVNDTFDINIYLTIDGSSTVSTFSTSFQFDNTRMVLESVAVPTRPIGYEQESPFDLGSANASGIFERFDSLNPSEPSLSPGFDQIIGTLRFRATASGTNIAIAPLFYGGIDGVLDDNSNVVGLGITPGDGGVFFQGASLNFNSASSVPEPSSLVLAGAAAAGWFLRKRTRRRNS